jgi:hypothetical protein
LTSAQSEAESSAASCSVAHAAVSHLDAEIKSNDSIPEKTIILKRPSASLKRPAAAETKPNAKAKTKTVGKTMKKPAAADCDNPMKKPAAANRDNPIDIGHVVAASPAAEVTDAHDNDKAKTEDKDDDNDVADNTPTNLSEHAGVSVPGTVKGCSKCRWSMNGCAKCRT